MTVSSPENAEVAVQELSGTLIHGQPIQVRHIGRPPAAAGPGGDLGLKRPQAPSAPKPARSGNAPKPGSVKKYTPYNMSLKVRGKATHSVCCYWHWSTQKWFTLQTKEIIWWITFGSQPYTAIVPSLNIVFHYSTTKRNERVWSTRLYLWYCFLQIIYRDIWHVYYTYYIMTTCVCSSLCLTAKSQPLRETSERQQRPHCHRHLCATAAVHKQDHHGQLRHTDEPAVGAPSTCGPAEDCRGTAGAAGPTPWLAQRPAAAHHCRHDLWTPDHTGLSVTVKGSDEWAGIGWKCSRLRKGSKGG